MSRSVVDAEFYIFASDIVDQARLQRTVAVVWAAKDFDVERVTLALRRFCHDRGEIAEVWFVAPADCAASLERLLVFEDFIERTERVDREAYRFYLVDGFGGWAEEPLKRRGSPELLLNADSYHSEIKMDGMRQLFRDSDALVTAGAGVHFGHPSGTHSEQFIRASQAVARAQHAYFVAACALHAVTVDRDLSFWADTAGILPFLFALRDLLDRLRQSDFDISVDTFAGYDGVEGLGRAPEIGYLFISSTTSGGLAKRLASGKLVSPAKILTLFSISAKPLGDVAGRVLVDLTNRDEPFVPSVRDARVRAYPSDHPVDGRGCRFCAQGIGLIELSGDGFFPRSQELSLRMLRLSDRPWLKGNRPQGRFDGDEYFTTFVGKEAIVPALRDRTHDTTLRLKHLLVGDGDAEVKSQVVSKFEELPQKDVLEAVVAMPDEDSRALAAVVAAHLDRGLICAAGGRVWARGVRPGDSLEDVLEQLGDGGHAVLCAGVVASGRLLQAQSRAFRIHSKVRWSYFIGGAHPESPQTWDVLKRSLSVQTSDANSDVRAVWSLPREPRVLGEGNPWQAESNLLAALYERFEAWGNTRLEPLETRSQVIDNTTVPGRLMSGPSGAPIAGISPGFALWPSGWTDRLRTDGAEYAPTQAEIYATVAHLMAESRRGAAYHLSAATFVREYGTALNPAVFDRFNDPIIQASILRAARRGELDYRSDLVASRAMSGVLLHVWTEVGSFGGEASYEFVLALLAGLMNPAGSGLRLADGQVVKAIQAAIGRRPNSPWPPLLGLVMDMLLHELGNLELVSQNVWPAHPSSAGVPS